MNSFHPPSKSLDGAEVTVDAARPLQHQQLSHATLIFGHRGRSGIGCRSYGAIEHRERPNRVAMHHHSTSGDVPVDCSRVASFSAGPEAPCQKFPRLVVLTVEPEGDAEPVLRVATYAVPAVDNFATARSWPAHGR